MTCSAFITVQSYKKTILPTTKKLNNTLQNYHVMNHVRITTNTQTRTKNLKHNKITINIFTHDVNKNTYTMPEQQHQQTVCASKHYYHQNEFTRKVNSVLKVT